MGNPTAMLFDICETQPPIWSTSMFDRWETSPTNCSTYGKHNRDVVRPMCSIHVKPHRQVVRPHWSTSVKPNRQFIRPMGNPTAEAFDIDDRHRSRHRYWRVRTRDGEERKRDIRQLGVYTKYEVRAELELGVYTKYEMRVELALGVYTKLRDDNLVYTPSYDKFGWWVTVCPLDRSMCGGGCCLVEGGGYDTYGRAWMGWSEASSNVLYIASGLSTHEQ